MARRIFFLFISFGRWLALLLEYKINNIIVHIFNLEKDLEKKRILRSYRESTGSIRIFCSMSKLS